MSNWKPVESKLWASAVTGSLTALVVWLVSQFGVEITPEAAGGIVLLLTMLAHYFVPERNLDVAKKIAARNDHYVVEGRQFDIQVEE